MRYDIRIKLEKIMDEGGSKVAMVDKFRELFGKILDNESSTVLYLYFTSYSATPIAILSRAPIKYTELKRFIPSLKPPVKNGDIVYGQIYVSTNTMFKDWNTNFLE